MFIIRQMENVKRRAPRIFGLDILRAVAIMCVIVAHTYAAMAPNIQSDNIAFYLGYIGVEIFFVLSGFLIAMSYELLAMSSSITTRSGQSSWLKAFWIRRWLRTLPNYYLILIIFFGFSIFIKKDFNNGYWYYAIFSQNLFQRMPGFFMVSWSLSIEEWFYLLFPLLLIFFSTFQKLLKMRTRETDNDLPVLLTILLMMVGSFIFRCVQNYQTTLDWNLDIRKVFFTRLDSLAIGVLCAYLLRRKKFGVFWVKHRRTSFYVGLLFFVYLSHVFISKTIFSHQEDFIFKIFFLPFFSLIIGLFIPFFYGISDCANRFLHNFITRISLYSYSMYLSHIIITTIVLGITHALQKIIPVPNIFIFVAMLLGIYFLASIQYRYFEKPIMDLRNRDIE